MERECCEICNNELAPDRFQTHLCVDLNEITCEYCTSSFKSTIELCEHLKVAKHTEVIYECDKCPMIFSTATLLTFHQTSKLTHTEIIPDFQNSKSETETINIDMDVSLADKSNSIRKIYKFYILNFEIEHNFNGKFYSLQFLRVQYVIHLLKLVVSYWNIGKKVIVSHTYIVRMNQTLKKLLLKKMSLESGAEGFNVKTLNVTYVR